jgi:recombination protein RecT
VSGQTIGAAVAVRDNSPTAVVQQYKDQFAMVLPSHMKPEAFVRVAIGVLRRNPKLAEAAQNDMGAFMAAMMDAARLGLEPGTEQYWLIPRYDRRLKKIVVSGQKGYQGEIELIYRAGATAGVIVEVVREADEFIWKPGRLDTENPPRWHGPMDRPIHDIDWKLPDRGPLTHVYAYGLMKSGGVSKVIVLDKAAIDKAKAVNEFSGDKNSPWQKWDEPMWLKTGVHRLQKFVPTSSEYIGVTPGPALAATAVPIAITAPSPAMPSNDEMWDEVAVGHDHEDDDFHEGCEGCRAESAAADREANQ